MNLKRFYADNFRNIKSCDICFTNGVNLLYGMNAQGKTNVVEGIYTFSRGRSFRTSEEGDMIKLRHGEAQRFIEPDLPGC